MKICFFSLASFFIGVVRYCTSFQWSNVVFTRLPQVLVHLITISVNGRMCLTMTENGILLMVTPLQKEQGLNTIAMEMVKKLLVPHLHIKKVNCIYLWITSQELILTTELQWKQLHSLRQISSWPLGKQVQIEAFFLWVLYQWLNFQSWIKHCYIIF